MFKYVEPQPGRKVFSTYIDTLYLTEMILSIAQASSERGNVIIKLRNRKSILVQERPEENKDDDLESYE